VQRRRRCSVSAWAVDAWNAGDLLVAKRWSFGASLDVDTRPWHMSTTHEGVDRYKRPGVEYSARLPSSVRKFHVSGAEGFGQRLTLCCCCVVNTRQQHGDNTTTQHINWIVVLLLCCRCIVVLWWCRLIVLWIHCCGFFVGKFFWHIGPYK